MKILILYSSSEGQTQKIARKVADHLLEGSHSVELVQVSDAGGIELDRFDRVILAASIHVGSYQEEFSEFIAGHVNDLRNSSTLFLSVSLAAAGHDAEDWRGLDLILQDLEAATGWTPGKVEQIAGAYRPSQYDIFRRYVMRRIIREKDPEADTKADKEYTDWNSLFEIVQIWLTGDGIQ